MASLFNTAKAAAGYLRRRLGGEAATPPRSMSRGDIGKRLSSYLTGRSTRSRGLPSRLSLGGQVVDDPQVDQRPGAPPIIPGATATGAPPVIRPPNTLADDDGDEDDIVVLGRDATYHKDDWAQVMDGMRATPGSSNVYGYYFERESVRHGILYVTFLGQQGKERGGMGSTYAYYDIPMKKWREFQDATESSAGKAVWDYLRVRGTIWGHQHQYRLVQAHGKYVPRKATKKGFRTRTVTDIGTPGRRNYRRSTLPERLFNASGKPDRGAPNRGNL